MPPRALLAIRSDIAPDIETEYLDWLTKEHTIERVGIEGFVSARIFRCDRDDIRRYLILYELENAAVVDSPAYLERLNNPTPWSSRMMPHLCNFVRGGGEITNDLGSGFGAAMMALRIDENPSLLDWPQLEELSRTPSIVAIRLLETDADRTSVHTNERSMRSGDRTFGRMLFIEALERTAMMRAVRELCPAVLETSGSSSEEDRSYALIFSLT